MSNPLIAFLAGLLKRLFAKSPLFFKVWQLIMTAALAVSGLPSLLQTLGVTLSPALTIFENKFVTVGAAVGLFMSLLSTQGNVSTSTDANGKKVITTETDPKKLPFTSEAQQKLLNKK